MGNYNDISWLCYSPYISSIRPLNLKLTSVTSRLEYKPLSLTHQGREKLMIQLLFSLPSGRFSKKKNLLFSSCKNEKDENQFVHKNTMNLRAYKSCFTCIYGRFFTWKIILYICFEVYSLFHGTVNKYKIICHTSHGSILKVLSCIPFT